MGGGGVRAPVGLAGAAVLVVVLELVVFRAGDDPASFITANWRESGRAAASESMAVGGEVLCLGDSQVKCGLLPRVLQGRLGLTAYNLALIGGQAPSSYYLLARALKAGARPRAIVVDFTPSLLASDLRINTGMWPELLGLGECVDLILTTRDIHIAGPLLVRAVLPSLRRRDEVRAGVQGHGEGREKARAYLRNWRLNAGRTSSPSASIRTTCPRGPFPARGPAGGASRRTRPMSAGSFLSPRPMRFPSSGCCRRTPRTSAPSTRSTAAQPRTSGSSARCSPSSPA